MILKFVIIWIVLIVFGCLAINPILKSKLGQLKDMFSEKKLRKYYLVVMSIVVGFEILLVGGAAVLIGFDNIFRNRYFTIVLSALFIPIYICFSSQLKKLVHNESVYAALDLALGFVAILLAYSILPYLGFAPVW